LKVVLFVGSSTEIGQEEEYLGLILNLRNSSLA
jgi:hypothetical protein